MTDIPGVKGRLLLAASEYSRSRSKWIEARRSGLGASDTSAILGLNPWATPYSVWRSKVEAVPEKTTEAIEWGNQLEDPVARMVAKRHPELGKLMPTPGLLQHEEYPWMLATLDRLLVPRGKHGALPTAPLEIKTVGEHMYRHHWIGGFPPPHIQVQVQQQMAVTGFDHAYVAVLVGGQKMPEPILIERDQETIDALTTFAAEWWDRYVVGRQRPPLTFADRADMTAAFPGDPTIAPLVASGDLLTTVAFYADAKRREKEAADDLDQAGWLIKRAMGDATALLDDSGNTLATWTPRQSARFDTKSFRKDHPKLAEKYTQHGKTRTFTIKEINV